jgi:hypothetical protein
MLQRNGDGTLDTKTIDVRISASASAGPISGVITDISTGAAEQDVTVSGTVTAAAAPHLTLSPATLP